MSKTVKTIRLEDEQIDEIEELDESHPVYRGRGFAAVVRMLLDYAISIVKSRGEEGEDEQE